MLPMPSPLPISHMLSVHTQSTRAVCILSLISLGKPCSVLSSSVLPHRRESTKAHAGMSKRIEPGPGQESVWDYPRPPRVEQSSSKIEVKLGGKTIASTTRAWRVLETSHPPVRVDQLQHLG